MLIDFLMNHWQKVALIIVQIDIQVIFPGRDLNYIICHITKRCTVVKRADVFGQLQHH